MPVTTVFLIWLVGTIALVIPCWHLLGRIGRNPGLALLNVVPVLGLSVVLYVVALASWPAYPQARSDL